MSVEDRIPANSAAVPGGGIDHRLDRILALLERLRGTGSRAVSARLAAATHLVEALQSIIPELQQAASSGRWDRCDAIAARAAFEIYDRAVRELRAVALEARHRIEDAETACAKAREFARRRRRQADKMAARRKAKSDGAEARPSDQRQIE